MLLPPKPMGQGRPALAAPRLARGPALSTLRGALAYASGGGGWSGVLRPLVGRHSLWHTHRSMGFRVRTAWACARRSEWGLARPAGCTMYLGSICIVSPAENLRATAPGYINSTMYIAVLCGGPKQIRRLQHHVLLSCKVLALRCSLEWTSKGCAEWGVRVQGACARALCWLYYVGVDGCVDVGMGVARSILLDPACLLACHALPCLAWPGLACVVACFGSLLLTLPFSSYMLFGHIIYIVAQRIVSSGR